MTSSILESTQRTPHSLLFYHQRVQQLWQEAVRRKAVTQVGQSQAISGWTSQKRYLTIWQKKRRGKFWPTCSQQFVHSVALSWFVKILLSCCLLPEWELQDLLHKANGYLLWINASWVHEEQNSRQIWNKIIIWYIETIDTILYRYHIPWYYIPWYIVP